MLASRDLLFLPLFLPFFCVHIVHVKVNLEEAAARRGREERLLERELTQFEESEAGMMKAMRQKLEVLSERNENLKEELRSEEAKTRGKTLSLEAAVGQLRAELKCWGTAGSPSQASPIIPSFLRKASFSSDLSASEVWSGRASNSSGSGSNPSNHSNSGSNPSSQRPSATSAQPHARKARRRPTTTFKPLQQVVAGKVVASTEFEDTSLASGALHSLRQSVSGLMDDALLRVGELLDSSEKPRVSGPKETPKACQKESSETLPEENADDSNASEGAVQPGLSDLWQSSSRHRESASAALAHFGALLQQQVNSAAEMAVTAMPTVSSGT